MGWASTEHDPRIDQQVVVGDDRTLGYAEWGTADAPVVIDLHGGPGCRIVPSGSPTAIAELGVRWITIDRPGLGLSDPLPDRSVADWASDVEALVDRLDIDRFSVLGWSMGGPYAAATAAGLGDRVTGVALLGPAPVTTRADHLEGLGKTWAWELAHDDPWALADLYRRLAIAARHDPGSAVAAFSAGCSPPEVAAFDDPHTSATFVETIIEATRQGSMGLVDDLRTEMAPWGFEPSTIGQTVHVWEATDDSFSLPGVAQAWADAVPHGVVHTLDGAGHLFPFTHLPAIAEVLLG